MARNNVFFAMCAPGFEPVLHQELRSLRFGKIERQVGGVHFEGRFEEGMRANLWLRTAVRVLMRLDRFEARDADALYRGISEIDWSRYLRPTGSLVVQAHSKDSSLDHTLFIEQKTKDAIVDQFRERTGERPSIDKDRPDLGVFVHFYRDRCTLSVDMSGDSLHKRGWRRAQTRAPLSETLAAAVLQFSRWDRRSPLLDPFCGSGTLLIEAALLAGGYAPGRYRERFGFEAWPSHDEAAWRRLRDEARDAGELPPKLVLRGWDEDPMAVAAAKENVIAAGFEGRIEILRGEASRFAPRHGWNAWVVTNPPYGERIGAKGTTLGALYNQFGQQLREHCEGYHYALLSGNPKLSDSLGLTPDKVVPLQNGALECRLLLGQR
ncbi:MAG: THUMP domain-containing protein [Planctomycetota bacterium]